MAAATRWISAAAAFGFMIAAVGASADMVLIRGAKVFDGLKTIGQRDVLLDQGRIKLMSKHIRSTAKMQVIEGGGKMLMPGLMDGHVHTFPGSQKDALRFGITTVFDMYSLADKDTIARWRRQRSTYEAVDEADTFTAGIGATPPGGHPTELFKEMPADMPPPPTLADNASAKAFMAARVDAGSDYIKILQDDGARPGRPASLPAFSPARFSDVIGAAKATGKRVVVHVQKLRDARIAVANGADALAHAICDAPLDREIIRSIVAKDVAQTATLDVYDGVGGSEDAQTLVKDPAIAPYLSDSQKGMLSLIWPRPRPDDYAMALANTAALAKAGAVFIAGTDAPEPHNGVRPIAAPRARAFSPGRPDAYAGSDRGDFGSSEVFRNSPTEVELRRDCGPIS